MGVHNLPLITKELMAHGRAADTPAALVRWGTKPIQETLVATVGDIAQKAAEQQFKAPAIFVVGDVVSSGRLCNGSIRSLSLAFASPSPAPMLQAPALTRQLENLGASCIEVPTIRIEPPSDDYAALDTAIDRLTEYDWLIFTSTRGVDAFFRRLALKGLDSRALGQAKLAAIGSATADALLTHGLTADVVPRAYCAEGL